MHREIEIRCLNETDRESVQELDMMSGNDVEQWIEDNEDYAWGIFHNGVLFGYCTVGYADDCPKCITECDGYTTDSLLLSDVFIDKSFRGRRFGTEMLEYVLDKRVPFNEELVFITLLHDDLSEFYEGLGFEWVDDTEEYCMVLKRHKYPIHPEWEVMRMMNEAVASSLKETRDIKISAKNIEEYVAELLNK